jgi:broad specificity phosphatase PhoE
MGAIGAYASDDEVDSPIERSALRPFDDSDRVIAAVRAAGDATSEYSERSSNLARQKYYFVTRGSRACLSTGRTHSSNNFEVHAGATPDDPLWYRCLSEHCVGTRKLLTEAEGASGTRGPGGAGGAGGAGGPTGMWTGSERYTSRWTKPFELGARCVMMLRAEMGTGKTHQLREYLRTEAPARVLLVAFRISLCEYFGEYLSEFGFAMYNDERLRETHLGDWQGMTHAQIDHEAPGARLSWREDATWAPHGGESRVDVAARSMPLIAELVSGDPEWGEANQPDRPVVLVAHGGLIAALSAALLRLPIDHWPVLGGLGNGSWVQLSGHSATDADVGGIRWRLDVWNASAEVAGDVL